ncbi:hypothetical protein lbkm_0667 [Lachnospiraceae bacterium KM106-2]|nr:hypothetical protein lbkm_0667 [Lachnospiraceae bacterium KM106-2]
MNKNRYKINRENDKAIKKYDHNQMETFATSLYISGFEDGKKSVPGIDLKEVEKVIRSIKGIGQAKAGAIMENINKAFGTKGEK